MTSQHTHLGTAAPQHYGGVVLITRRAALTALVLTVSGCAASPVIDGTPALAPSSPAPTQAPQDSATQSALTQLAALLETLVALPAWTEQDWVRKAAQQVDAHLALLSLPDPLSQAKQEPFVVEPAAPTTPATADEADKQLDALLKECVTALDASAAEAAEPELRLAWASAATATAALRDRSVSPSVGGPEPQHLVTPTREAGLEVAISHAWALVYGLGVGLGRLDRSDPLYDLGTARLAQAKKLRNELRAAFEGDVPEQPASFELPTDMDDSSAIKSGWATLETNLLNGYATLVAADDSKKWRSRMQGQIKPLHALGAEIGTWPGWVA